MLKISQEDRMFLISHGVDISLPLCQNDLWGVLDIIVDALVDSRQSHNNEVSAELKKLLTELIATIQKRNKRLHNQEKRSALAGRFFLARANPQSFYLTVPADSSQKIKK